MYATQSLTVGSVWDLSTIIPPLITPPEEKFEKAMSYLGENEEWLIIPEKKASNIYSPGIKTGIQVDSNFFNNTYPLPILGLMRAENLNHAIEIANKSPYGLTSGLFSLDAREKITWLEKIEAGNRYLNKKTTQSYVQREPFGGYKQSTFGHGYKTCGPNFLFGCAIAKQHHIPINKQAVNEKVNNLTPFLDKLSLSAEQLGIWYASIANYAYWWNVLKHERDPAKIIGQDNIFGYICKKNICLFIDNNSSLFDSLRICAATLTCSANLTISWNGISPFNWSELNPLIKVVKEEKQLFLNKVKEGRYETIRLANKASSDINEAASYSCSYVIDLPVLANGRVELLNYLREITFSADYDRYGNLGTREEELRKPNT